MHSQGVCCFFRAFWLIFNWLIFCYPVKDANFIRTMANQQKKMSNRAIVLQIGMTE
jgi:hypothetical protein